MRRYTVVWDDEAINDVAGFWMEPEDRDAILRATQTIQSQLAYDASERGVERSEGLRRLTVYPLAVLFEVSESDRIAKVLRALWLAERDASE